MRNKLSDALNFVLTRRVHWFLISMALYWVLPPFFTGPTLILAFTYLLMFLGLAVSMSFFPNLYFSLRHNLIDNVTVMTLGIVLAWLVAFERGLWSAVYRIFDFYWMRDSYFVAFMLYQGCVAGALHVMSPGAINGRVPQRNWILISLAIASGLLLAVALITITLDVEP